MTPQPAALAAAMISRGRAGPPKRLRPPALSIRLAIACTTAGLVGSASAASTPSGWPMPVIPQWPILPAALSACIAGTTSASYCEKRVAT